MIQYISIQKNGDIEQKNTKHKLHDAIMFKLCNFKTNRNFGKVHCYPLNGVEHTDKSTSSENCYEVYGKSDGRANGENKYDFPPPIDNLIFFGNMCVLKKENNNYTDLSLEEWTNAYDALFGGFESLDTDEERSLDSTVYDDEEYTKEGYHKDSFIVEDGDEELVEENYV